MKEIERNRILCFLLSVGLQGPLDRMGLLKHIGKKCTYGAKIKSDTLEVSIKQSFCYDALYTKQNKNVIELYAQHRVSHLQL